MKHLILALCLSIFSITTFANESNRTDIKLLEEINYSDSKSEAVEHGIFSQEFSKNTIKKDLTNIRNRQIRRILRRESQSTKVNEAMAIKRAGLRYVRNFRDFSDLSTVVFDNPTKAYLNGRATFVVENAGSYLQSPMDLDLFVRLENDFNKISDVINHKRTGMQVVGNILDYTELIRMTFGNPSKGMKQALGKFISESVQSVPIVRDFDNQTLREAMIQIEQLTHTISSSIAARRHFLQEARNVKGFLMIAKIRLSSPAKAYRTANSKLIGEEIGFYVKRRSAIRVILRVEAETNMVSDAMKVKRAGLKAATNSNRFWNLTEYAFNNPSKSYKNAVSNFITKYSQDYGK